MTPDEAGQLARPQDIPLHTAAQWQQSTNSNIGHCAAQMQDSAASPCQ